MQNRRHDIDALRALAFLLLIFYHVGMFYVSWGWHVKSQYALTWLEGPMLLVNQWRMSLIFVISGLAVHFLIKRIGDPAMSGWRLFRLRSKRLLLPLLVGMLLVIPPQAYLEARAGGYVEPGYWTFFYQYLTFVEWPDAAFAGAEIGLTWTHLWYLPYLWLYTTVLALLLSFARPVLAKIAQGFGALKGIWIVLVPVFWLMPIGAFVFPLSPWISHDFLNDAYAHALYGSMFFFGVMIGRGAAIWQHIRRLRIPLLILAPTAFVVYRFWVEMLPSEPGTLYDTAMLFLVYLNRWSWILLILGWGFHLLNKPMPWLNYANKAVFPWYIFHQTVTIVAGVWLARFSLGPVVEPLVLVLLTILGCALLTAFVMRLPFNWKLAFGVHTAATTRRVSPKGQPGPARP